MEPFAFRSHWHLADGYGRSGMFALKGLREIGAPVQPLPLMANNPPLPDWAQRLTRTTVTNHKWEIIHASVDALPYFPWPHRILWTMWEGVTIPYKWFSILQSAPDVVLIVPSEAIKETFVRSGVTNPIYIVPLAVDITTFQPQAREWSGGRFTVIHWSSLIPRKCPVEMINVFHRAFPDETEVRLIIKTRPSQYVTPFHPQINDPRVSVLNADMTPEELNEWVGNAHAGLFLSHGEGFYLEPLEASLTGLPCVVPTHTGCAAWADPKFFGTVSTIGTEPNPSGDFGPGQEWYTMNYDEAARQLRAIYLDYPAALDRAAAAAEMVRTRFAPATIGRLLTDTVQKIDKVHG